MQYIALYYKYKSVSWSSVQVGVICVFRNILYFHWNAFIWGIRHCNKNICSYMTSHLYKRVMCIFSSNQVLQISDRIHLSTTQHTHSNHSDVYVKNSFFVTCDIGWEYFLLLCNHQNYFTHYVSLYKYTHLLIMDYSKVQLLVLQPHGNNGMCLAFRPRSGKHPNQIQLIWLLWQ